MAVSTTTTRNEFTGNGVTTVFTFTFKATLAAWVKVTLAGVLQSSGFTVALNADQEASPGGTVTFAAAPASAVAVGVYRQIPLTQGTSLAPYSPFPAKTLERGLDLQTMLAQQLDAAHADEVARATAAEAVLALAAADGIAGGNNTLVTAAGAPFPTSLSEKFSREIHLSDHVSDFTGATDQSTGFLAAVALAMQTGKTLVIGSCLGSGSVRVDSQVVLPNDGGAVPKQKPLVIRGAGAFFSGQGGSPVGGSILDLRYAGAGAAKIVTLGLGLFQSSGVTFEDTSGSSVPFLLTTNTTLHFHRNSFVGSKTGTLCDQDVFILGGTTQTMTPATTSSPFQGYGTVLDCNYFHHVRRIAVLNEWANSVVIRENTIWNTCGTNMVGGAAIDLVGGPTYLICGNTISDNLIEIGGYPYGVRLDHAANNKVRQNDMWDSTSTTIKTVLCTANSNGNTIHAGFFDGAIGIDDLGANNTYISTRQGDSPTRWANAANFAGGLNIETDAYRGLTLYRVGQPHSLRLSNSGFGEWSSVNFDFTPPGGAEESIARIYRAGAPGVGSLALGGAASVSGGTSLKLLAATGSLLWLGDVGGQSLYWNQATKTLVLNDSAAKIALGNASGTPTITAGAAAPSAAEPDGSVYYRGGSPNGSLYVMQAGAWKQLRPTTLVGSATVTYSASMTPDATAGDTFHIVATNGTAFTINVPTGGLDGQRVTIIVYNSSGGALGTATWAGGYRMASWTQPANGTNRAVTFVNAGGQWREVSSTPADVTT